MKDDPEDEDSGVWSSGSANESPSSSTYGSQRASRNMAEKQRRDNLNTQIQAMAALVPTVSSGGTRKKDKISVLRLATAHLRIDYTLGPATNSLLPAKFRDVNIEKHILDSVIGSSSFMLAITSTGKIVYVSEHVEQYLGHEQSDLIGDSLYNYVYHDDHEELTRNLTVDESLLDFSSSDDSKEDTKTSSENDSSSSSSSSSRVKHVSFKDQRRNFNIRMSQRANSRRENVHYEYLQVSGVLRIAKKCNHFLESSSTHSTQKESSTSNDVLFVGVARLLKKRTITELSLLEANKNEYFTRHLVDGRIIFCDHRISLVAGYMAEEVSGTSAFKFMYKDDVRWTIIALRHMYDQGKNYGSSCYRLETKTGEFIYLRTHGYLEYDETTQSVGSFICINTLTSKEEGERLNKEMKKRFSATISDTVKSIRGNDKIESTNDSEISSDSEKNTEDLSELEDAITHLISDLPSPGILTEGPLPDAQFVKAAIYSQRLPPASLQASKIGIKEIENKFPCIGKGKNSAKKNSDESKSHKKNSEKNKNSSDKHISDMENSKSPLGQSKRKSVNEKEVCQKLESFSELRKSKGANKNIESSTNLNPSAMSSQFHIQNDVKDNYMDSELLAESLPQMNLKRSYKDVEELDMNKSSKKRASDNCVTVELISIDDQIYPNGNLDFQNYIPVKSLELENNLDVSDMYQLTNDQLDLDTTADPLLNFQDLQGDEIFSAGFDNSQDLMKLFSSLPQDINYDDDQSDLLQFANSDQSSVLENSIGRNHLELPHTMSSCESQFSDLENSMIQTRCDSFIQTKPEHKIQKQKLQPLQHSHHKMPVKVKHNIGV